MKANKEMISNVLSAGTIAVLTGGAATQLALEHCTLKVRTQQSEPVLLDPISNAQKTIYISIKNTSGESVDITPQLKTALSNQGYRVVKQPNLAHYLLQATILKVGAMSVAASHSALGSGYGSAIAGGLADGVIGLAADLLVKDVNYTMITDVQISERAGKGIKINKPFPSCLKNGISTVTSQTSSRQSQYQRYLTRIVSNADQVNLKFTEARIALEQGLVETIIGIFLMIHKIR